MLTRIIINIFVEMTTISFIKYKKNKYWAFKQMGEGYKFFKNVEGLLFFKFLGTGSGTGFSLFPDFSVYAILCVWESEYYFNEFFKKSYHTKIISEKAFSRKDYFLNTIKSNTDCLNSVLSEQGACPCPPNLIYNSNDNTIVVTDTDIGNITIKSC